MHDIELNFNSNGTLIFKNLTAAVTDTATYSLSAGGEYNFLEILGTPTVQSQVPADYNGKWTIIRRVEGTFAISMQREGYGVLYLEFVNI